MDGLNKGDALTSFVSFVLYMAGFYRFLNMDEYGIFHNVSYIYIYIFYLNI